MTLPTLTFKYWTGAQNEYFDFGDMNRVWDNVYYVGPECGVVTPPHRTYVHADQFWYDDFQLLENTIKLITNACGTAFTPETAWGAERSVSYVDFERVELGLYTAYVALGGRGQRVPSDKKVTVARITIPASGWTQAFPYAWSFTVYDLHTSTEGHVMRDWTMDAVAWAQSRWANLRASVSERSIAFYADGYRPTVDLKVIVITEPLSMFAQTTIQPSAWAGSGPWTCTMSVAGVTANETIGEVGMPSGMTTAQNEAYTNAGIRISAIGTGTITIQAVLEKPTVALPVAVIYENDLTSED